MSASARDLRLILRGAAAKVVLKGRVKPESAKPAKVEKAKGPAFTPRAWNPGCTVADARRKLAELLIDGAELPPVLVADPIRPLALRSHKLLLAQCRPECSTKLKRWIASWCRRHLYLVALASPDSVRCDLDGNPVEEVTPEQRQHAAAILASRLKR